MSKNQIINVGRAKAKAACIAPSVALWCYVNSNHYIFSGMSYIVLFNQEYKCVERGCTHFLISSYTFQKVLPIELH